MSATLNLQTIFLVLSSFRKEQTLYPRMSSVLFMAVVLTLIQVVLFFGQHNVEADFSDNCVNSTDSLTCIRTYEQLYNSLAKSDNSFNIVSALYPAMKPSSVRVFVNVHGPKETEADIAQYTWSISCLYAALPAPILHLWSLGSILVTPRTQTLNITIPLFCCNVSKKEDERKKEINKIIKGVLAAVSAYYDYTVLYCAVLYCITVL